MSLQTYSVVIHSLTINGNIYVYGEYTDYYARQLPWTKKLDPPLTYIHEYIQPYMITKFFQVHCIKFTLTFLFRVYNKAFPLKPDPLSAISEATLNIHIYINIQLYKHLAECCPIPLLFYICLLTKCTVQCLNTCKNTDSKTTCDIKSNTTTWWFLRDANPQQLVETRQQRTH